MSVENVVASSSIGQELDLDDVAFDLDGAEYDPGQFPGVIYRTRDPETTALIFRSGKVVVTGAQSVADTRASVVIVREQFADLGIEVRDDTPVAVQNIVASADLGAKLNLNAIAIGLGLEAVEYEPEQFHGLVYRLDDPEVVVLLFGSGKLVLTGGTETEQARRALETVRSDLDSLGLLGL